MRSLIFIPFPFRRLRVSGGDEAERIAFPDYMDDVEQFVAGGEADAGLSCFVVGAGVFVARQRIEQGFTGPLEPNAVSSNVLCCFLAVPDEELPVEGGEDVHIDSIYTPWTQGYTSPEWL